MKWNSLAQSATRWWSAPARFPKTPLSQLRKAVLGQYAATEAWLHQHTPVGIKAPSSSDLDAVPPR
jgi:hypothetical protein